MRIATRNLRSLGVLILPPMSVFAVTGCSLETGDLSALLRSTEAPRASSMTRLGAPIEPEPAKSPATAKSPMPDPEKQAQRAKPVRTAQAPRASQRAADEAEMLARARAEVEAQRAVEEQRAEAEKERERQRLAADREAELAKLSERMRRAEQARRSGPREPVSTPAAAAAGSASGADSGKPVAAVPQVSAAARTADVEARSSVPVPTHAKSGLVTVLLVMDVGTRGIRRFEKTGDPLLCGASGCYVSTGPGTAAKYLAGRKAFGFFNTMGGRAGACSQSLGCVFRGVDLGVAGGVLQPVDMRLVRHDRREQRAVTGDSGCRLSSGALDCRRPINSSDYRLWVVPEDLAEAAGTRALEQSIAEGLPNLRQAMLLAR